jgi:ADP-heptose:LPS heptosyltransferase
LVRLFAMQPDAPPIIPYGDIIPPTDLYCMMGSLPWLLGAELHNLPAVPYLRADPVGAAAWEIRLPGRPRIGIIWAGNAGHADDQNRSMPLRTMLEMLDPGMTIVSLQKDVPEADRATLTQATHVIDLSAELTDLSVTAAVMDGLDLIISVDTAPAHLAGALGRPLWLLLPFAPDWRWMLDREDSPWYPSARLFRQDQSGDWSGVAGRVREALKGLPAVP